MHLSLFIISILLSVFSTSVMSYVALATPIGPWIAPTLVLIVLVCSRFLSFSSSSIVYIISGSSIGGIVATACAFSFPTLYFLDAPLFNNWMQSPGFFMAILGIFSFLAGTFGFFIAEFSENLLIETQQLSFPIGQLVYKMINARNQMYKAAQLIVGFFITLLFYVLHCFTLLKIYIPKTIIVFPSLQWFIFSIPQVFLNIDTAPMVWAIGFVTGHVIALPLAIGALAAVFLISPLHKILFSYVSFTEFSLAFCSGIVFCITLLSVLKLPQQLINGYRKKSNKNIFNRVLINDYLYSKTAGLIIIFLTVFFLFFSYFQLQWYVQLYLLLCSIITTYQIAAIAGRIGLALLGRFATFVMVPAMLLFNLNYTQVVLIATFVEISGGVAADILCGRKLAQLSSASSRIMRKYQLLGLVITSISIGIIFWYLINHFGLGSPELFAYRAQSRQLLVQAQKFDIIVLIIGAVFGFLLHCTGMNPLLVLGGLLMPFDITFGLVVSGFIAHLIKNKEELYPFWSGIFASNSMYMLLRAICIR